MRSGIHKFLVRIAKGEDPDQTASSESSLIWDCAVCRPFLATSVQNFITFIVCFSTFAVFCNMVEI